MSILAAWFLIGAGLVVLLCTLVAAVLVAVGALDGFIRWRHQRQLLRKQRVKLRAYIEKRRAL